MYIDDFYRLIPRWLLYPASSPVTYGQYKAKRNNVDKTKRIKKEMKVCPGYCGVACVDGSCPKALQDEYAECGYDVVRECKECCFYEGCEDCRFEDTDMCVKN